MDGGRLAGKAAIVTGGGLGIGRAAALLFAKEGARVAVLDVSVKEGESTAAEINSSGGTAVFIRVDVSREDEVKEALAEVHGSFGSLDVLVNNAGITGVRKPTHEVSEQEWDLVMAVNVKGVFFCTKHAVPFMKDSGGGSIINVASFLGMVSMAGVPPYTASKAAVRYMSKTDALIYAPDNIRVNSVNPGYIRTPLIENYLKSTGDAEKSRAALVAMQPIGRLGEPEDVAYGILYLASDESKFITGSDLVIDGGLTAR
jgi:NAD(P)-dependent dehydrogenase (short-subunit alcohol dehydrogenase family)